MANNQDFEDLLRCLNDAKAKYLIVGAYAMAFYTEPRYTKDIDIWIEPSKTNGKKVYSALTKFGAPIKGLRMEDLEDPELVYQIGVAPMRIDIMMKIDGVGFDQAWKNRKRTKFGSQNVNILGIKDLIKNKKATDRPQDKIDLKYLQKI